MNKALNKAKLPSKPTVDSKKQLEAENQDLGQKLQKAQRRVTELKQTVARLEQENRSLHKKLDRLKEKQRQSSQPPQANRGMKTLAGQLEGKAGKAKQAAAEASSQTAKAPQAEPNPDPYKVNDDRLMRAYFGDRQDFSKKSRGR